MTYKHVKIQILWNRTDIINLNSTHKEIPGMLAIIQLVTFRIHAQLLKYYGLKYPVL
jgi:hypothetical protein